MQRVLAAQVLELCGYQSSSSSSSSTVYKIERNTGVILTSGDLSKQTSTTNCTRNFEYPDDTQWLVNNWRIEKVVWLWLNIRSNSTATNTSTSKATYTPSSSTTTRAQTDHQQGQHHQNRHQLDNNITTTTKIVSTYLCFNFYLKSRLFANRHYIALRIFRAFFLRKIAIPRRD